MVINNMIFSKKNIIIATRSILISIAIVMSKYFVRE